MKKLILDSNEAYESFQLWWVGLTRSLDLMIDNTDLKDKLKSISKEIAGDGRVLIEPCELELSDSERIFLIERMTTTPWKTEMIPYVETAIRMLGNDSPPNSGIVLATQIP